LLFLEPKKTHHKKQTPGRSQIDLLQHEGVFVGRQTSKSLSDRCVKAGDGPIFNVKNMELAGALHVNRLPLAARALLHFGLVLQS
jgi:hypothetical protein